MSCNYADGLSPYDNKGKLGIKEEFDSEEEVNKKVDLLAEWINDSKHVVVHTGAGISTSAGIPDFRGPNGVWTLEAKGLKPSINISFNDAVPTKTHMALKKMIDIGKVHFIVSQNIDGLHLKSGVARKHLSELHGNMFVEQCNHCHRQFVRKSATTSVGQKNLQIKCPGLRLNGRPCRGDLYDVILDWEHNLPEKDLGLADFHSCCADLSICLGTTLQIIPSGTLPLNTKKFNDGRLVICNLQPTKYDKKANLVIHTYVDDIMVKLMKKFNLEIPEYNAELDPTKRREMVEWTIPESEVKIMRKKYEDKCCKNKRKKIKLEKLQKSKDSKEEKEEPKEESAQNCSLPIKTEPGVSVKLEPEDTIKNRDLKSENCCDQKSFEETSLAVKNENQVKEERDVCDSNGNCEKSSLENGNNQDTRNYLEGDKIPENSISSRNDPSGKLEVENTCVSVEQNSIPDSELNENEG